MTLQSQSWKVPKQSPISHGSLIFFIRNILIAQIEADTNRRATAEKFAEDFKFTENFPHVQFLCIQMKHQKLQSISEASQRYLTVWSWLLPRECGSECVSKTLMGACHKECATCKLGAIVTSVRAQHTPWEHLHSVPSPQLQKAPLILLSQPLVFTSWAVKLWPWQWQVKSCQTLVDVGDLHLSTLCNIKLLPLPCRGDQGRLSYTFQNTARSSRCARLLCSDILLWTFTYMIFLRWLENNLDLMAELLPPSELRNKIIHFPYRCVT